MSQLEPSIPKRGRPRSDEARRRALSVAREILMKEGFGRLTMESVAAQSGVGKPTLYRHWANAQELAMASLLAETGPEAVHAGGTAKERLVAQLAGLIAAFATTRGRQIAMALASADPTSEMTRAFRNRVILASREAGRMILADAVARGEIEAPVDTEALLDMVYGPLFYRLLVGHQPLEPRLAAAIVEIAWASLQSRTSLQDNLPV